MRVLCFGIARDIIGHKSLDLQLNSINTVSDLKNYIVNSYPGFQDYKDFQIAINQNFAIDTDLISDSDEIAIIPPVSGG